MPQPSLAHAGASLLLALLSNPSTGSGQLPQRAVGCYDATLERVILIGGPSDPSAGRRDRVWSWSGSRWEPVTDRGPQARGNAAVGCDARARVAVVTGGARGAASEGKYEVVAESWEGSGSGWRAAGGADIDARDHHAIAYDDDRGLLVLFGGIGGDRQAAWPRDTWERRGGGWVRVATDGPPARGRTGMVYDRRRRQLVLFGGASAPSATGDQTFLGDTWIREGSAWRKAAETGPRGRYAHGMVYDERAGVVLMYSGAAAHRDAPLADLWRWDGETWREIPLTGPTPGHRYQPVMVYDRARARTVLYGGAPDGNDDTWEWDGTRWTRVAPSRPPGGA